MYDIIIKNGTIIDGTGEQMYHSDIAVKGNQIVKIGELHNEKAEIVVDAMGKYVCPGFIDINNHSDTYWQLFLSPNLESLAYQGITTIVGGNCGSSLAPLVSSRDIETIQKWADIKQVNVNWLKLSEFFDVLEKKKLPVNFATLTGHGTLRRGILKDESRNLVSKELEFIKNKLEEAMGDGSLGLSTGLVYTHARLASTEELTELAKIIKKFNGVYATHIRGEGQDLVNALEEAVTIAQNSGAKLHISHLKAMGEKNWPKMEEALDIIDHTAKNGTDITFDIYPYTSTGSVLYTMLPAWVSEGGKRMLLARLRNSSTREKVIAEMKESEIDYSKVEISISPLNKTLARRRITEIADQQGKDVENTVIDMLIACEGRIITSMEILSEENIRMALKHPLSIIATNGSGYGINHRVTGEVVHPRSFGTFPRVLEKYVKESQVMSWEKAIRKMTGLPAEKFGLAGRGQLKEGFFSDILVLDKNNVSGPATKDNPYQYAKGIDYSLVNGEFLVYEGQYMSTKFGKVIRK